ncbi:MAG TPA: right-handed parallel beta-helix repeat-containing protein [Acidimicrobiales bacterium]|nr:right-handed parallel beta-helix repeat-containing protein [Acidimicrobiales bacterium]
MVAAVVSMWWEVGPVDVAGAVVVSCGQTITQNTVLTADVGPCPVGGGNGIIVGASNITLDLNGHQVLGTANAINDGAGIYVLGRTGVTVRNGTVRNFDCGVAIEGGSGNTVTGIFAQDNIGAVGLTRCGEGVAVMSSQNNRVANNRIVHNGPFGGIGVYTRNDAEHPRATSGVSRGNVIDGNQVTDNNLPRSPTINDSDGIRIETLSVFNIISNNTVTGSGLDGISMFSFAPDNTVRFNSVHNNGFLNTFRRRGDGIRVFGGADRTTVVGNRMTGNAANGIIFHGVFDTPSGPRPPATNSTATNNFAVGNNVLPPLEQSQLGGPTFDLNDGNPNCDNNTWRANIYRTANPACTTIGGTQV